LVTNIAPGDYHLYARDLHSRVTTLVDADTNAVGSNLSPATVPSLSEDGRLVAFDCQDGGLVPGDFNRDSDLFVRDLSSSSTELISAHDPTLASATPNGASLLSSTSISSDGRFTAFASEASNLVPGDTNNCRDIFLRDTENGTVLLVSVATNGLPADGVSFDPAISSDGRYVAFTSMADNLVLGDTNQDQDVFVRDVQTGTTTLVSVNSSGAGSGNAASYSPILSADGRYVLFQSLAMNLAPATGSRGYLFFRDLQASTNIGLPTALGVSGAMTRDGRYVFYLTPAAALSASPHIWDSQVGGVPLLFRGLPANLNPNEASFSPDGKRLAVSQYFSSLLVANVANTVEPAEVIDSGLINQLRWSANGSRLVYGKATSVAGTSAQVWFHDFSNGTNILASHTYADPTAVANGPSDSGDISPDGRFVAYRSTATNIVVGVTNGQPALYLFDAQTGVNTLLVQGGISAATVGNRPLRPFFSGDGRSLYFASWATDLAPNDFNHNTDLFAYSFLYAVLVPPAAGQDSFISWPSTPGKHYRVEYKNGLEDPNWHELAGIVTSYGNKASIRDPETNASHRLYRIVIF
jgi:Tol biopolymer transport system component